MQNTSKALDCNILKFIVFLIVVVSFFTPSRIPRSGYILYLCVAGAIVFLFFRGYRFNKLFFLFFTPVVFVPIAYIRELTILSFTTFSEFRSFLVKMLVLCGINFIASYIFYKKNNSKQLLELYSAIGLILAFVTFQQFFDIFNINNFYITKLNPKDSVQLSNFLKSAFPRPLGFIGNPNELGFQLAVCYIASLCLHINLKRYTRAIVLFCLGFTAVMLTGSRSSMVMLITGSLIVFLCSKVPISKKMIFMFFFVSCLMVIIYLGWHIESIQSRIVRMLGILAMSEDRSWNLRGELYWWFNIKWFAKSPFFGVGTLKTLSPEACDNEWLLLLRQVGIMGVLTMVASVSIPLIYYLFKNKDVGVKSLAFALLLGGGLYMIPAAFVSSPVLYCSWSFLYFGSVFGNSSYFNLK